MRDWDELQSSFNAAGINFVITELETALMYLDLANSAQSAERRAKHIDDAVKARKAALLALKKLAPEPSEQKTIATLARRVRMLLNL